jgi:hypothetical protein
MHMAQKSRKKEEPVYEKLEPNSCMIISKSADAVLYACNEKGRVKVRRAKIPKD